MKLKNIIQIMLVSVFMLTLSSFKPETKIASITQDSKSIIAIFDEAEEYGYNFIFTNDDEDESTITFHNVNDDVLKTFDLKSDALIGTTFKVTYKTQVETEKDDDGYEHETEVLTITKLEKIKK